MKSIAKIEAGFTIFKFDEKDVRVVDKGGDPWFLATDLVSVLNLDITAVRKLDDDEKGLHLMQTPGGMQDVGVVSEAGMYTLILRCRDAIKPGTVPYRVRKWVTGEVLPSIRKSGSYETQRKVKKIAAGKITADQQEAIKQLVMNRGKALPKEKQAKAIITMWSSLKSHFGCTYKEISENQFTEALSLAARVPLEGEFIAKQCALPSEPVRKQFTDEELINLSYMWIWMDKGQRVSKAIYPAMKQIGSTFSGYFYDMGHETRYMTEKAREALIRETANIDKNGIHARHAAPMLDKLNGKKELH